MGQRAIPSGVQLNERDAAIVKDMLARGDRQHDIAAWFGVNGGRIAEIATRQKFRSVAPVESANFRPLDPIHRDGKQRLYSKHWLQPKPL
jgi:hypothetical protein